MDEEKITKEIGKLQAKLDKMEAEAIPILKKMLELANERNNIITAKLKEKKEGKLVKGKERRV